MGARSATAPLRDELDARDLLRPVLSIARSNHVSLAALLGRLRFPLALRVARREVFTFLHVEGGLSFPTVGRLFGRHHTTVLKVVHAHEHPEARAKYAAQSRASLARAASREGAPR